MTTFTIQPANYARGPYRPGVYGEAAGESFKQGEFVYLVNGLVTVCADDATTILGMANQDASGTTSADVEVILALPDTEFEMTVYEDGGGSNDTIAVTDLGVAYAYEVVSNRACINTSDTGNDALIIKGFRDAVGDIYPRVYASVLPAACQFGAAAT